VAIKQAAVKKTLGAVASMNPDNMLAGGLMDDFDGTIVKARLVPWDYNGNIDHDVLAVALTIQPDNDNEFVQHYSCGELDNFMPSMDGETAVDPAGEGEALEGIYALKVGKKDQLNNNTNWAHFLKALIDAQFDVTKITAAVSFVEGVYGHFNRIPQKKRSGIVVNTTAKDGKTARANDILVVTELKDAPAATKTAKKTETKATKAAPAKAAPADDDLGDKVTAIIVEAIEKAGDDGLAKSKLAGLIIKNLEGAEKAKGVKIGTDNAWLSANEAFAFDADSGVLFGV